MKQLKSSDRSSGSSDRFGYEWDTYSEIIPEYEAQFLKWVSPLQKSDFKNKKILDAGCGIGRNSYWPLKYGAKEVIAFDYDSRTVDVAKRNLANFKNTKIYYGSIYDIPYEDYFDIAFSIGVIHHLAEPRKAVSELVKSVKKGGKVLIWIYGYEGNEWIVRYINPVRKLTSKLPLKIVHILAHLMTLPLYVYIKLLNPSHPYLNQLSKFKFWHIKSIVFDQLIPKIANYWKKEEALALFEAQGLKNIKAERVNSNSWSVIGIKG